MSTSFLPFPTRFFSRKSRSKRAKTSSPEHLKPQPTIVHHSPTPPVQQPVRTAPSYHSQGYAASRHTESSVRSAHTAESYQHNGQLHRGYPDSYLPRKIPSMNELSHRSHTPSPQPRPHARHVFKAQDADPQVGTRHAPRHRAPLHPLQARERDDMWRGRRFSEQATHVTHAQPAAALSRSTSVGGHGTVGFGGNVGSVGHGLEPPWQQGLAASIEEESDSDSETAGRLDPLEVLEAFFNEEPMPDCIQVESPVMLKGPGPPTPLSPPAAPPAQMPAPPAHLPLAPPPPNSPPPPLPGVGAGAPRSRSRTPQHLSERPLPPATPPRRPSPSSVEAVKPVPVPIPVPPPASPAQANPGKTSFSLPRLRRNSSRASRHEPAPEPPSPSRDEDLPYSQRPLPPTPPERGDSFRSRLLRSRRRSGEVPQPDAIQEEEMEPPLKQLGEALKLSPATRPMSLVAYIIPPEERAQIGRQRRSSTSSVSSTGESAYSYSCQNTYSTSYPQAAPQPMPISPFRLTFNPPTGLNPPPRPRSSMVSTRSAASSNAHWSPPQSVLPPSTLRASPMVHDDVIAHW